MLFTNQGPTNPNDENFDARTEALILEAALLDMPTLEVEALLEDTTDIATAISENVVLERTIVRLDKTAKLSKARKMAVFAVAKERNDPKFKKLMTVWKWERFLEAFLDKKYGNEAMRRAKKSVSNSAKSKSKLVATASKTADRSLNLRPGGKYAKHNSTEPKAKLNMAMNPGNK